MSNINIVFNVLLLRVFSQVNPNPWWGSGYGEGRKYPTLTCTRADPTHDPAGFADPWQSLCSGFRDTAIPWIGLEAIMLVLAYQKWHIDSPNLSMLVAFGTSVHLRFKSARTFLQHSQKVRVHSTNSKYFNLQTHCILLHPSHIHFSPLVGIASSVLSSVACLHGGPHCPGIHWLYDKYTIDLMICYICYWYIIFPARDVYELVATIRYCGCVLKKKKKKFSYYHRGRMLVQGIHQPTTASLVFAASALALWQGPQRNGCHYCDSTGKLKGKERCRRRYEHSF